jgi:hypothetical protein
MSAAESPVNDSPRAHESTAASSPLVQVEKFDVSGLPAKPSRFLEQRLAELIKEHKAGDIPHAIAIQQKLAEAYRARRDTMRADAAEQLVAAARHASAMNEPAPAPASDAPAAPATTADNVSTAKEPAPALKPPAKKAPFAGIYWRQHPNGAVEKWDFNADGTFLHQWLSGTRTSERGEFSVEQGQLVLRVSNVANAYAASTGYKQTTLGGSNEASGEIRRVKFKLKGKKGEEGIVIDGVEFAVRHWN